MSETTKQADVQHDRFPFLDGMRAISILWLVGFHSLWFLGFFLEKENFVSILKSGLPAYLILCGHFGVDIFFVLSGFLITHVLLTGQGLGNGGLGNFYRRRAFRILPAYFVCLGLYASMASYIPYPSKIEHVWLNFLLVNNYAPLSMQAMAWSWSLAIEEQFYIIFPLLFFVCGSSRKLMQLAIGLLVAAVAIRAGVAIATGPWPGAATHPMLSGAYFARYFETIYCQTHMRFGGLVCGIIARLAVGNVAIRAWFSSRPKVTTAVLAGAVTLAAFVLLNGMITAILKIESIDYKMATIVGDRYLFAAAVAFIAFHSIALASPKQMFTRLLSSPRWKLWAELSYGAFLLNPIAICFTAYYLKAPLQTASGLFLVGYVAACFALTFAASWVLFTLVENPMRALGRRGFGQPTQGTAVPAN